MSADLAAMRPGYNNIADTLRTGGAPFPFRAGATSAKPNLIYPLVLGSSPESGVAYNNITCGSPGGGAPPDPPTLSNPFKGPSVGAGLPAPRVERNGEKERKERKEKGKGWTGTGGIWCDGPGGCVSIIKVVTDTIGFSGLPAEPSTRLNEVKDVTNGAKPKNRPRF